MFEFGIGDDLSKIRNLKYSKSELEKLKRKLNEQISLGKFEYSKYSNTF